MREEINRRRDELRWLSGFAVFGSLLALPGLLPVTDNLNLDANFSQAGLRFFAFNAGFLLAAAISQPALKKFGVRAAVIAGLLLSLPCLFALAFESPVSSFWWQLLPVIGIGMSGGLVSIACLFALQPWSSRLGARALPRVAEVVSLGCIFSCVASGTAYVWGWGRFAPLPVCAVVLLCLAFTVGGRHPLAVIERRSSTPDSRTRQSRSIASFLLLCLLFVQLGSEWSVAGWLPLFLIHRLGSGPSVAIFVLAFFFLALLSGRVLAQRSVRRLGIRTLVMGGFVLALAGCVTLGFSASLTGVMLGLTALAIGFAPPYSVVKNVLDESLHFAPGFYAGILSVAVTGAMSSAWLLGYMHQLVGMRVLSLLSGVGSVVVFILELLLIFESHLMAERAPIRRDVPAADRRTS